jgi:hypothetical protein
MGSIGVELFDDVIVGEYIFIGERIFSRAAYTEIYVHWMAAWLVHPPLSTF